MRIEVYMKVLIIVNMRELLKKYARRMKNAEGNEKKRRIGDHT